MRREYEQRLQERRLRASSLDSLHYRLGNLRVLCFLLMMASLALVIGHTLPAGPWLLLPMLTFAPLTIWHSRIHESWRRAQRAAEYYQAGLRRLDGTWTQPGTARGRTGTEHLQEQHPYARDLDLFGRASLFELICRACTRMGEDRLAHWLLTPSSAEQCVQRQARIRDLMERQELREQMATLTSGRSNMTATALGAWLAAPPRLTSSWLRLSAALAGSLGMAGLTYWVFTWDYRPLLFATVLVSAVHKAAGTAVHEAVAGAEPLRPDCQTLALLLARLEEEEFAEPLLSGDPAAALARLQRLLDCLEARRNLFIAPVVWLSLSTLQFAAEIERWRRRHAGQLRDWLEALAEFEALSSLATFACEAPLLCWPTFQGQGLRAQELMHPLLGQRCVGNDVDLTQDPLWMISGSNMAGKSSLLRALGTNVVLAMAGAPVCARAFQLEPLQVGASIRVTDSLQEGISRFYAEISRLRQLHQLASARPRLLFLLDEILAGTNSHDRKIGAEAVIRALLRQGAIGLVTTHDLALTEIEGAVNLHFADEIQDGNITFDYRLHPGPVTRSNALELMRSIGLEV